MPKRVGEGRVFTTHRQRTAISGTVPPKFVETSSAPDDAILEKEAEASISCYEMLVAYYEASGGVVPFWLVA